MNKKAILMIGLILASSVIVFSPTTVAADPFTVRGYVYIDEVITVPDDIILTLDGEDITAVYIYQDGYYEIDGEADVGETGNFTVVYMGHSYMAAETLTITGDYLYKVNLTVNTTTPPNTPPNKPFNPTPENNSENIDLNPSLTVTVTDPDSDSMNVAFYNATDSSLIGSISGIGSGDTATVTWNNLGYNKTYSWYAIANDSEYETQSDTWSFTTKEATNLPPIVNITSPEEGALYLFGFKILSNFLKTTLIIGNFEIMANATDPDSEIEQVEFYINDEYAGNANEEPYAYTWTRSGIRLFHLFTIKVVAYSSDGQTADDEMTVRKFL